MNPEHSPSQDKPIEPWQLTAFALGELEPLERDRVQSALDGDPTLQREYAEIQKMLSAVSAVLEPAMQAVALAPEQSAEVTEQMGSSVSSSSANQVAIDIEASVVLPANGLPFYRRKRFAALLATAAMVPIGYVLLPQLPQRIAGTDNVGRISKTADPLNSHSASVTRDSSRDVGRNEGDSMHLSTLEPVSAPKGTVPSYGDLGFRELAGASNGQTAPTDSAAAGYTPGPSNSLSPASDDVAPLGEGQSATMEKRRVAKERSTRADLSDAKTLDESVMGRTSLGSEAMAVPSRNAPVVSSAASGPAAMGGATGGASGMPAPSAGGGAGLGATQAESSKGKENNRGSRWAVSEAKDAPPSKRSSNPRSEMAYGLEESMGRPAPLADAAGSLGDRVGLHRHYSEQGAGQYESELPDELRANVPDSYFRRYRANPQGTDRFEAVVESPFLVTDQSPLSTFSIDVDTASYSKIRQHLTHSGSVPSPNMVRIEEMINYFEYEYQGPADETPFAAHMAIDRCPWNLEHQIVRIGLQAKKVAAAARPKANIVFLLDVSGSMDQPNKLPLVKKSLTMLASQLTENDRVAIVVYAGAAGCVLPSIPGSEKQAILSSLDHLNAGGSTNGGQGIQLAYSIAKEHFIPGGINRVILCTDGDFNVGVTGDEALVEMMQENAKSNVFLTCLGYGMGNFNDTMMEKISNRGNGIYGMIDNEIEARRMMVEQLSGTLVTVAKDVKIQVDFNPKKVASYRLIGYDDRRLANQDFANDAKDAGEIGAGHRVTALYEIVPVGKSALPDSGSEKSKYQASAKPADETPAKPDKDAFSDEMLTLKVRFKEPEASTSVLKEFVLKDSGPDARPAADHDLLWAEAVAEFGLLLRQSKMAPNADWNRMIERAEHSTIGNAYRLECVTLMRKAAEILRK